MYNPKKGGALDLHRPFILALYLPSLCNAILQGAQNLIVPLYLSELAFSFEQIGVATGAFFFGVMLGELPSGALLNRFTTRQMMVAGALLLAISSFAILAVSTLWAFVTLRLVAGFSMAMFSLSRHSFATGATHNETRGSVITWLGGMGRFGRVIGPFTAGFLATQFGLAAGFGFLGGIALLGALLVLLFTPNQALKTGRPPALLYDFVAIVQEHWQILMVTGVGQFFMQLIRTAPRTIIPLYGQSLGLAYDVIGLIETIGGLFDTAFFWTSGGIMDRFGRKFAIIPSLLLQSIGVLLIPLTGGFVGLAMVNSLMGLGNSISSGTMMTLASDLAPTDGRNAFLGLFRLSSDFGISIAPSLVGLIAGAFALGTSATAIGFLGFFGVGVFIRFIPETLQKISPVNKD